MKHAIRPEMKQISGWLSSRLVLIATYIIHFLICIGEWTQWMSFLPFRICWQILSKWIKRVYFLKYRGPVYWFVFHRYRFYFFRSHLARTLPFFRAFIAGFICCLMLVGVGQIYYLVYDLPNPASLGKVNFARSSHLYDRNGKLLYEIYRDVNRTPVRLSRIPESVKNATLAIEDRHFYQHRGISFMGGIVRALKDSFMNQELQGGSTITQQLIKTALLTPERTFDRKIKEMILAIWTEQLYSKEHILEMYLNQVSYGGSAYGIEEAANIYFDRPASKLTLAQAALLAGLPKAPSIYSPFVSRQRALQRRNQVLQEMEESGFITQIEMDKAKSEPLGVVALHTSIKAPHFVFYVKSYLENEYGSKQVEEGGLEVLTTLDLAIQQEGEKILKEEIDKIRDLDVSNGGIVVLKPDTGEILAMVGSTDYFSGSDGAFNITTALRQPGSTLKPPLYALALQRGYTASTLIDDSPIIFQIPGAESYQPVNYDGRYHGKIPLRYALSNSYNIPAIKVLNTLGVQSFIEFARLMGIESWPDTSRFGLSIALGGAEVSLVDLARVYTVFATGGYRTDLQPVLHITDNKEHSIGLGEVKRERVLDEGIAYIITHILSDNHARQQAFGPNSALEIPGFTVAVKTGTSNDRRDNLTVGYTPDYTVAVWVGNNNNSPMNPHLTSGITGAAPIWNRMMKFLLTRGSKQTPFRRPSYVVSRPCYAGGKEEIFIRGTEAKGNCVGGILAPKIEQTADASLR